MLRKYLYYLLLMASASPVFGSEILLSANSLEGQPAYLLVLNHNDETGKNSLVLETVTKNEFHEMMVFALSIGPNIQEWMYSSIDFAIINGDLIIAKKNGLNVEIFRWDGKTRKLRESSTTEGMVALSSVGMLVVNERGEAAFSFGGAPLSVLFERAMERIFKLGGDKVTAVEIQGRTLWVQAFDQDKQIFVGVLSEITSGKMYEMEDTFGVEYLVGYNGAHYFLRAMGAKRELVKLKEDTKSVDKLPENLRVIGGIALENSLLLAIKKATDSTAQNFGIVCVDVKSSISITDIPNSLPLTKPNSVVAQIFKINLVVSEDSPLLISNIIHVMADRSVRYSLSTKELSECL